MDMEDSLEQKCTVACNRRPFLSDSGCDRGDVDVNQFADFPYCDPISPDDPEIPPELMDSPLYLPVPPPCACINIKHKIGFKYSTQKKFEASASFSADGDCCEGNYNANLNLQIPCPINKKDDNAGRIKVKIDYGNGKKSDSASFLKADASSCTIEPLAPEINLNLPCPVKGEKKPKVKASIKYGSGGNSAVASYASADSKDCTIGLKDASLNLRIPCPIKNKGAERHPKIRVRYMKSPTESACMSSSYVEIDSGSCEARFKTIELDLRSIIGGAGGYPQPFEFRECCVESGEFYFDGELKSAEGICPGDGNVTVYLVCRGRRKDAGSSSGDAEYEWDDFHLSTSEETAATGEKVLNVKLYDLSECKVLMDYRGVNLPIVSGGAPHATIDDYGPFPVHYLNGAVSFIGDGYVQVGGYTISVDGGFRPTNPNEFIAVKISSGSSSPDVPEGNIVEYSSFGSLRSAQHDLDCVIIPIYRLWWDNLGAHVLMDLRRMPMTGMLEVFLGGSSS